MRIISPPKAEKELLVAVKDEAKPEDIREGIIAQAECCVDHLCGCSCSC